MRNYSKATLQTYFKPSINDKSNSLGKGIEFKSNLQEKYIVIGKYKYSLDDYLGIGYSSKVYKCVQVQNIHKKYAIKIVELKKFRGSNLEMLQAEINIHQSLIHQNILRLYEVIKTPLFYYIILEYCPHGSLSEYIKQVKKLTQKNSIEITSQILQAYKYLMQQKVLHRDIKPGNILRIGNKWKLSDFGFAVKSKYNFKDRLSVGTLLYMSPETLTYSPQYSIKSDIFALGIILYEMIEGTTPWQCCSQKQLIQNMKNPIVFHQQIKNPTIKQFILKACQLNATNRMTKEQLLQFSFKDNSYSPKSTSQKTTKSNQVNSLTQQKSQTSCNSASSTLVNPLPVQSIIKNHEFYRNSFQYAKLLYSCINNFNSFLVHNENKHIFGMTLFKYLLKEMKILCDYKVNQNKLKHWNQYIKSQYYKQLYEEMKHFNQKIQKQFLENMRNNEIKIIRAVNRKFPCLSHNAPITTRFYQNFKHFMIFVIRQHNHELLLLLKQKEDNNAQEQSLEKGQSRQPNEKLGKLHCDKIQALQNLYTLYNIAEERSQQGSNNSKSMDNFKVVEIFMQSQLRINDYYDLYRLIRNL